MPEKTLQDVLIRSSLADPNPQQQIHKIVDAFNRVKPPIGRIGFKKVQPNYDEVVVLQQDGFATLVAPSKNNGMRTKKTTTRMEIHKQTAQLFGACGVWVVNVPCGKWAKVWSGGRPILLDEGPHVVYDKHFSFDPAHDFVDQSEYYIQHGNIHIITIPPTKIAKVWYNSNPLLLTPQREPYVFIAKSFVLESPLADMANKLIVHGPFIRIIPYTGEIAVTCDGDKLATYSHPIEIQSSTCRFWAFLPINNTIKLSYNTFSIKDGTNVDIQLTITFEINQQEILKILKAPPQNRLLIESPIDQIRKKIDSSVRNDIANLLQKYKTTAAVADNIQQKLTQGLFLDFLTGAIHLNRIACEIIYHLPGEKISAFFQRSPKPNIASSKAKDETTTFKPGSNP